MTTKRNTIIGISAIAIFSIIVMYIIDSKINPGYIYKSIFKLIVFMIIPMIYTYKNKNINLLDMFKVKSRKYLLYSLFIGLMVYAIIMFAYLILKNFIDLENIKRILDNNLNVNRDNFIFISIYISFVNSLLEEFFFRGFLFLNLNKLILSKYAYIVSSLAFAIYHVAIMANWFNVGLFIIAMTGLFVGGLIFNYLNDKGSNIYGSWLVHMMANFAINTVGFIMFGII